MFWQIFQHMQFVHDCSSSLIPRIRRCSISTPLPISRDLHQWKFSSFMYFIRQTKNRRALDAKVSLDCASSNPIMHAKA